MKLRPQLLLVSLFVLSLPWAGCQYLQEVEHALRDGQMKAMAATARAVAARMGAEADSIDLPHHPAVYNSGQQFYLHPLRSAAIVDGYPTEWEAAEILSREYIHPARGDLRLSSYAGWYEDQLYLYFAVRDASRDYHNPQQPGIANGDHLVLRAYQGDFAIHEYIFRSSGTGGVTARYLNEAGNVRQEHRVRGEWRETEDGYHLELGLPLALAKAGLDFYMVDAGDGNAQLGNINEIDYPAPWIRPSRQLAEILADYADEQSRITLLNVNQWLLAEAGSLSHSGAENFTEEHPVLAWLYRVAISHQDFRPLDSSRQSGRMDGQETSAALRGEIGSSWYSHGRQRVGRVAAPVEHNGRIIGVVAVEQSTDSLLAETNAGFRSLFWYTLLATGSAGLGLLSYASWLSFRIRRLNRAADTAVAEDGSIHPELLRSAASDEIGDLTRSYGRLLSRLRDYTDYLRSLSSKLSHELRTPLAVMNSSLENLGHEPLAEGAQTYVQRAREASQRLSTILNAMSSASRMEESIQQAQRESLPLDALLRELVTAYRSTYAEANLELRIEPDDGDYAFAGSPDLIVQMLDKLLDNALDFCPPEGSIRFALERHKQHYQLSVSNSGPLLPAHMQGQLFDSLVSVRDSQHDSETHLGLGLYIVRLIVDFHGGQVAARNLPDGSGVSFVISLPR